MNDWTNNSVNQKVKYTKYKIRHSKLNLYIRLFESDVGLHIFISPLSENNIEILGDFPQVY